MDTSWSYTTEDLLRRRILSQIKRPLDLTTVSFSLPVRKRKGSSFVTVDIIPNDGSSFPRGKSIEYRRVDIGTLLPKPIKIVYRGQVNVGELLFDINRICDLRLRDTDIVAKRITNTNLPQLLEVEIEKNNLYFEGKFTVSLEDGTEEIVSDAETLLLGTDFKSIRNYLINLIPNQAIDSLFLKQIRSVDVDRKWCISNECCQYNLNNSRVLSNVLTEVDNRNRRVLVIQLDTQYCKGMIGYLKLIYD